MVLLKSLVLAGLAALAAAGNVMDLTPDNFDDIVLKSGKPTLVEFFAPWCGHCKKLAPIYEELGTNFLGNKDVQIAKVDADAEKTLGRRFGIQGFPTLKWFDGKSDKPEEYNSGRDLESLTKFITEKTGAKVKKAATLPSQVQMLDDSNFSKTIGHDKNVIVAFTASWCGHCKNLAPEWEKLAHDFVNEPNVVIAKVDAESPGSKKTAEANGISSYPTIHFYPARDSEFTVYSGERSEKALVEFLNGKAGTDRLPGGGLGEDAGTIYYLDEFAKKWAAGPSRLAELTAEAKKVAKDLGEKAEYKYAEYYIRVFDKLAENEGYVAKEAARLDKIIRKGGLAPAKLDELQSKSNILRQFVAEVAEKVTGKDEL
ncbi:disulfide isomerase [Xylariaceae sp. FL0255]|nr:disulfide isomerase [Xylariaceae sp. FL0255]